MPLFSHTYRITSFIETQQMQQDAAFWGRQLGGSSGSGKGKGGSKGSGSGSGKGKGGSKGSGSGSGKGKGGSKGSSSGKGKGKGGGSSRRRELINTEEVSQ